MTELVSSARLIAVDLPVIAEEDTQIDRHIASCTHTSSFLWLGYLFFPWRILIIRDPKRSLAGHNPNGIAVCAAKIHRPRQVYTQSFNLRTRPRVIFQLLIYSCKTTTAPSFILSLTLNFHSESLFLYLSYQRLYL